MNVVFQVSFGLAFSILALSQAALANEVVVEAYGDSLTAGFLSATNVTHPPDLSTVSQYVNKIYLYGLSHDRKYLVSLHSPELAWPNVFIQQIAIPGETMQLHNQAVTGAVTADLMSQLKSAPPSPGKTVAFFFMGHNDMVRRTDSVDNLNAQYRKQLDAGLAAWDASHTGSIAYVLPIGQVSEVYHLLKGYVWHETDQGRYACENSWDMFVYPRSYAQLLRAGTLDTYLTPRIEALRAAESDLAEEWDKKTVHANHFRYLPDVQREAYQREYFAVDCFHLSADGQRKLGEAVAKAVDPKDWR